ncbi:MAG: DUF4426 domain-containing protein [Candidatus Azotimanducaceae bacterium]
MRASTILVSLFLYTGSLQANHIKVLGYEINYSAFSAAQIDKDLMLRHELGFSEKDLVVNINISPNQKPDEVLLTGSAKSLLGAKIGMSFKKILEKGTVFYLTSVEANEDDFVSFNIEITLPNQQQIPIKFVRRYD